MNVTRYQAAQSQRIESRTHRPYIADGLDQQGHVIPTRAARDSQEGACGDDEEHGRRVSEYERAERRAVGITFLACCIAVGAAIASAVL